MSWIIKAFFILIAAFFAYFFFDEVKTAVKNDMSANSALKSDYEDNRSRDLYLSKIPIGVYLSSCQDLRGASYCYLTVRNNSGRQIPFIGISITVFNGVDPIATAVISLEHLKPGETLTPGRLLFQAAGRSWNRFEFVTQEM